MRYFILLTLMCISCAAPVCEEKIFYEYEGKDVWKYKDSYCNDVIDDCIPDYYPDRYESIAKGE